MLFDSYLKSSAWVSKKLRGMFVYACQKANSSKISTVALLIGI